MKHVLLPLVVVLASPAWAQGSGAPANVNDCTLLSDPVDLRNCILRFEGNRTPPPVTMETSSDSSSPSPAGDGSPEPGGDTGRSAAPPARRSAPAPAGRSAGRMPVASAPAPRPRANDTETSIEQIEVPRRPRH